MREEGRLLLLFTGRGEERRGEKASRSRPSRFLRCEQGREGDEKKGGWVRGQNDVVTFLPSPTPDL